jgi:hypothetical protein
MPDCPHTKWLADSCTDYNGMVQEYCPQCGTTRQAFGSWEAVFRAGKVIAKAPPQRVFPHLDHDGIDEIMKEVKWGEDKMPATATTPEVTRQRDPFETIKQAEVLRNALASPALTSPPPAPVKKKRGRPPVPEKRKYIKKEKPMGCPCQEMVRFREYERTLKGFISIVRGILKGV